MIALGLGAYFLYLSHVGYQEVIGSLRSINVTLFSIAVVLALFGVLCDALAWRAVALKFNYKVPIWDIFLIYLSCGFMNNLIPSGTFAGETARVYFLEKLDGGSRIDQASATVAATRIITAIPFFLGTAIGLVYLDLATDAPPWALATCTIITLILLFLNATFFGICFADDWLERIIFTLINYVEKIFHIHVDRMQCSSIVSQFHQSMKVLVEHKRTLIISTFWAVAGWLSMTMVAVIVLPVYGRFSSPPGRICRICCYDILADAAHIPAGWCGIGGYCNEHPLYRHRFAHTQRRGREHPHQAHPALDAHCHRRPGDGVSCEKDKPQFSDGCNRETISKRLLKTDAQ